ncbi:MAG: peptidase MA family metallohydrolase, partial [Myxococcota bacterium]
EVARHGSRELPALAERLKVPVGTTVHVYVADDDAVFRAIQPGVPPTWADATAWPTLGAVFLRAPQARAGADAPIEQVLEHELVHVLLGRAFASGAAERPPHWLQEGVAQLLAGEIGPEEAATLQRSSLLGGPIPLRSLEHGFPADPRKAQLAYAESADFVAWLVDEHGEEALPALVRASAGGASMRQAVRQATGQYLEDVEATWQARWAPRPGLELAALASGDWVFGLGAVALAVAFVQRRRRFRRRLAEMAREEALVDALLAAGWGRGRSGEIGAGAPRG